MKETKYLGLMIDVKRTQKKISRAIGPRLVAASKLEIGRNRWHFMG